MKSEIMLKIYKDERINSELKKCLQTALTDEEYDLRNGSDFVILTENIDKIINYVESGCQGRLFLNSNIWYICFETLCNILSLYGLKLIGTDKCTESEEVVPIKKDNIKERIFKKMQEYGWNLGDNTNEDFNAVYNIHKDFLDSCYEYKCEVENNGEILNMNDISVSSFEDMLDFMSDFLRAINDIERQG